MKRFSPVNNLFPAENSFPNNPASFCFRLQRVSIWIPSVIIIKLRVQKSLLPVDLILFQHITILLREFCSLFRDCSFFIFFTISLKPLKSLQKKNRANYFADSLFSFFNNQNRSKIKSKFNFIIRCFFFLPLED